MSIPERTPAIQSTVEETELVIALVVAVGTDVTMVTDLLQTELSTYGYTSTVTRLSDYLAEQSGRGGQPAFFDEAVWEAMTDGDLLRERWERNDALALHAISDIAAEREARSTASVETCPGESEPASLERHAFILRSLKTQAELSTLRAVYGPRLVVIGAYSPRQKRLNHLANKIADSRKSKDTSTWKHQPQDLIDRDEKEERKSGQDVSGTFHQADFFIRAAKRKAAQRHIGRVLRVLFGDPFQTPTRDEHGQFLAAGAAMRSAELGRQVGAAITSRDGETLAIGTNEVPKRGGGSHWTEDRDDNRDFALRGRDTNRQHLDELASRLASAALGEVRRILLRTPKGQDGAAFLDEAMPALGGGLADVLRDAGLKDLTEFGRAVHAEMNALLDAARRGVAVQDATVYTTTFPCHNCARHIIGAGIRRVVFIEPYPKSKAGDLHGDSMVFGQARKRDRRVAFEPFVGVAPRRYLEMFDAATREQQGNVGRKAPDGRTETFDRKQALPVFRDAVPPHVRPALPAYREREVLALDDFIDLDQALEAKPLREVPSDAAAMMPQPNASKDE